MKRIIEYRQFQKALSLVPNLKYIEIDIQGESPDFLIEVGRKIIGVELICLYRDLDWGNAAKTQSDLPKIAEDSVDFYNKSNNQSLLFRFVFTGLESINCKRKILSKELGNFLVKWKEERMGEINENMEVDINDTSAEIRKILRHILIEPINSIVSLSIPYSEFKSCAVEQLPIEQAIRKKEKLISEYKNRCDDLWLLIVLPRMSMAADYYLKKHGVQIRHLFDKVYVFDEYLENICEIVNS